MVPFKAILFSLNDHLLETGSSFPTHHTMDLITLSIITTAVLLVLQFLWKLGTKNHDVFEKQGIKGPKPLPFVGSTLPLFMRKVTVQDFLINLTKKFPSAKIIGVYDRTTPVYMINDTELIKQLGVKDFEHFIGKMMRQEL